MPFKLQGGDHSTVYILIETLHLKHCVKCSLLIEKTCYYVLVSFLGGTVITCIADVILNVFTIMYMKNLYVMEQTAYSYTVLGLYFIELGHPQ